MSWGRLVSLGVVAALAFWAIGAYNRLVALRNAIGSAWTQLDALLKRRHALVESLLPLLRPELLSEQRALDAVLASSVQAGACAASVRARPSSADAIASLAIAEGLFAGATTRMLALLEQQPTLAQREDVAPLLGEWRELESRLGFARQWFNDAVAAYNDAVRQFPTRLLTPLFRFRPAGML